MDHIYHLDIGLLKAMATRLEMIEAQLGESSVKANYYADHADHRAALELRAGCAAHRIRTYIPGQAILSEVETQLRLAQELQTTLDNQRSGRRLCAYAREIVLALQSAVAKNKTEQRERVEDVLRIANLRIEDLR
jgi:hypothetical protein